MDNEYVFVVLVSYGLLITGESETIYVSNVSCSEETAWTSIERDINDRLAKNKFGKPYINIYPESRFVRLTYYNHNTNKAYKHYDYRIIRKPITD